MDSHLLKQTLNPIRRYLVTPIAFVPLLYQWKHLASPVDTVAHRIRSYTVDDYFSLLVTCVAPASTFIFKWEISLNFINSEISG